MEKHQPPAEKLAIEAGEKMFRDWVVLIERINLTSELHPPEVCQPLNMFRPIAHGFERHT